MAVGASVGMMGGIFYDLDKSGLDESFVEEVSRLLQEGKTAVIADVEEGWTAPVDTRMDALGAMVFRRNRGELVDEQLNREADALNAELEELEEEMKEANEKTKASIQKQIDRAKQKSKTMKEVIDKKMEEAKTELDAKSDKLNEQIQKSDERRIRKLDNRMATLMKNYETKKAKFSATVKKLSESLS